MYVVVCSSYCRRCYFSSLGFSTCGMESEASPGGQFLSTFRRRLFNTAWKEGASNSNCARKMVMPRKQVVEAELCKAAEHLPSCGFHARRFSTCLYPRLLPLSHKTVQHLYWYFGKTYPVGCAESLRHFCAFAGEKSLSHSRLSLRSLISLAAAT